MSFFVADAQAFVLVGSYLSGLQICGPKRPSALGEFVKHTKSCLMRFPRFGGWRGNGFRELCFLFLRFVVVWILVGFDAEILSRRSVTKPAPHRKSTRFCGNISQMLHGTGIYTIYTCIRLKFMENVGKCSIHGASGSKVLTRSIWREPAWRDSVDYTNIYIYIYVNPLTICTFHCPRNEDHRTDIVDICMTSNWTKIMLIMLSRVLFLKFLPRISLNSPQSLAS